MARFRVAFDGRWQASFNNLDDATRYASHAAMDGITVAWVVERRWLFSHELRAVFPEEKREAGEAAWRGRGWPYTPDFSG
jgi:hypothetical protein